MRKFIALAMAFFVVTSTVGCSALAPQTQSLSINCGDQGTKVQVNGNMYKCPTQIDVPRNKSVSVMAYKDGHHNYMRTIDSQVNGLFVLDLIGGLIWLVPFVGMITPGSRSLETQEINISMVPITIVAPQAAVAPQATATTVQ